MLNKSQRICTPPHRLKLPVHNRRCVTERLSVCQRRFVALKYGGKASTWKSVKHSRWILAVKRISSQSRHAAGSERTGSVSARGCVCVRGGVCVCVICETDSPPCNSGWSVVSLLNRSHLPATAAYFGVSNIPTEVQLTVAVTGAGTLFSCHSLGHLCMSVLKVELKGEAIFFFFLSELGETEGGN